MKIDKNNNLNNNNNNKNSFNINALVESIVSKYTNPNEAAASVAAVSVQPIIVNKEIINNNNKLKEVVTSQLNTIEPRPKSLDFKNNEQESQRYLPTQHNVMNVNAKKSKQNFGFN